MENGSLESSTGRWGLGGPRCTHRSRWASNPLQYYDVSCTWGPQVREWDTCGNLRVPSGRFRSVPRPQNDPEPAFRTVREPRTDPLKQTSGTVSEASLDTSRPQLFLGVGGSGRSPLECTTSEIRAGARAGVAFSSSRAARSLSGTARIRSYVVGDTKIVNCRFQSLLKSIESDPSANRLASNFQATPAQSS